MERSNAVTSLLERPAVYALWQAPFARKKLRPVVESPAFATAQSILDVGCGPGTNAPFFKGRDYLGIDLNPRYISRAKRKYGMSFEAADATSWHPPGGKSYDLVLINSLLHHLDDTQTDRVLATISSLLGAKGEVHILDLVLPSTLSPARVLARLDRGEHPRPLAHWMEIFQRHFLQQQCYPYPLTLARLTLWQMIYFRGSALS